MQYQSSAIISIVVQMPSTSPCIIIDQDGDLRTEAEKDPRKSDAYISINLIQITLCTVIPRDIL